MAEIKITIPNDKLAKFKMGFLKQIPVPTDDDGVPTMSEEAWVREWIKIILINAYKQGLRMIAEENIVFEEIIE